MDLGNNILKARKKLQLSQEQLGDKVGVTRQTISNWELNVTVPDTNQLIALSKALEILVDVLLDHSVIEDIYKEEDKAQEKKPKHKIVILLLIILVLSLIVLMAK